MSGDTSEEKTLPASARKLLDARKKGQIANSREAVSAMVSTAAFGYLLLRGGALYAGATDAIEAASAATGHPWTEVAHSLVLHLLWIGLGFLGPFLALLIAVVVGTSIIVNGGLPVAIDPILPKLERLDPIKGFQRILGLRGLVDLVKILLKLVLVLGVCLVLIRSTLQTLVQQPACGYGCVPAILHGLLQPLVLACCGFFLLVGLLDIGIQRWLFGRDMRMTRTEQKRERKDTDGNPLIKRAHRREQRALQKAVRTGLRNATFLIRGQDLALAFRFAMPDAEVPALVAKASMEAAEVMVEEARGMGLPIVLDAETASALALRLTVGKPVTQDLFHAVITCMRQAGVL
jgi:type III secretion protein U